MAVRSISDVKAAYDAGREWTGYLRKTFTTTANNAASADMSYSAGIPVANYYAAPPLVSSVLGYNDGIYAGPPVASSGYTKYLHKILYLPSNSTVTGPAVLYFHDIVMFYSFIDGDGGSQDLVNSIPIPRYGGEGCKIMFVSLGAGILDVDDVMVTYTNTRGVQRTVTLRFFGTQPVGRIVTGFDTFSTAPRLTYQIPAGQPYLGLAPGDSGVRSIDNVNFPTAIGGIFAAVIVKPLGLIGSQEQTGTDGLLGTPIEVDFVRDRLRLPVVADGAAIYPVIRATTAGTNTTQICQLSFFWG